MPIQMSLLVSVPGHITVHVRCDATFRGEFTAGAPGGGERGRVPAPVEDHRGGRVPAIAGIAATAVSQLTLTVCACAGAAHASAAHGHQQAHSLPHRSCPFIARDATEAIDPLASTSASRAPAARTKKPEDESSAGWAPGRSAWMRMMRPGRVAVGGVLCRTRLREHVVGAWRRRLAARSRGCGGVLGGCAGAWAHAPLRLCRWSRQGATPGARCSAARLPEPGRGTPRGPAGRRLAVAPPRRPRRPIRRTRRARARWRAASPSLVCRFRPAERSSRKVRCQRRLRMTLKPIVLGGGEVAGRVDWPAARALNVPGRSRRARILARKRLSFAPAEPDWVNSADRAIATLGFALDRELDLRRLRELGTGNGSFAGSGVERAGAS